VYIPVLQFFLDHCEPDLNLHFELIPGRLPGALKDIIKAYPPGTLRFEVGIQTFNPAVSERVGRKQDMKHAESNLKWLCDTSGIMVHADLIAGLPGEKMDSIGDEFCRWKDGKTPEKNAWKKSCGGELE